MLFHCPFHWSSIISLLLLYVSVNVVPQATVYRMFPNDRHRLLRTCPLNPTLLGNQSSVRAAGILVRNPFRISQKNYIVNLPEKCSLIACLCELWRIPFILCDMHSKSNPCEAVYIVWLQSCLHSLQWLLISGVTVGCKLIYKTCEFRS